MQFLGHEVTYEGIVLLNEKRDEILERLGGARTVKELRITLGMLKYYRKHMASLVKGLVPHYLLEGKRLPKILVGP